jgi:hypothetical protein
MAHGDWTGLAPASQLTYYSEWLKIEVALRYALGHRWSNGGMAGGSPTHPVAAGRAEAAAAGGVVQLITGLGLTC